MTTEIAIPTDSLTDAMEYAKALAPSDLLPQAYRGKPANVLLAVESGKALGIPPIQAINAVHIINGSPSLSANLMRALVLRAGHTFRITGDAKVATATIIRKDDPSYEHTATWDIARAKTADLLKNANWSKHPDAMLKARATAEVCRNACADVLMGFDYIEDELHERQPVSSEPTRSPLSAAVHQVIEPDPEVIEGEVEEPAEDLITPSQMRKMQALFSEKGFRDRADRHAFVESIVGIEVESSKQLTKEQASHVIESLDSLSAVESEGGES